MHIQDTPAAPVRFLEGERVYLRPIGLDDTDLYFRTLFHPEVRRLTGTQKSFTREQIYRYIEGKTQDPSSLLLLIALRETDEVIGDIALQNIDGMNRNANIRIAISSQEHQGRGLGTEAMRLLLDYGFGILNLHRIELNVFSYNARAIRAYEKLGFQREGVQREALYYNHQYHDSIIMSILEHEYRAKHLKKNV
ncbi:GNAT family N-acetyltransferase [Brevibacillus thermoruber]|jgi:RimJ/RimL family protein N-acetyltransferase|uniref:GNAT family protein n=1 Tax=Brevibacillus thermoruber TaxID=33942 RepID=A0A9X3TN66_9BACL|nr:GNAT family protein [Brevibacillus thermoruber]MDA5107587.1 GNAT family protein [Brevibacillus thermoruber]